MPKKTAAENPSPATLSIRVTPRAARSGIDRWHDGVLHIRTTAPPIDNAANAACCELVAKVLGLAARSVEVKSGQRSRNKALTVAGVSQNDLETRLERWQSAQGCAEDAVVE
jgi:uncharacterized protein YggU (UPF0235/DUF167 family)